MSTYDVVNDNAYKVFCEVVEENPKANTKELFSLFAKELALSVFDVCVDRYKEDVRNGRLSKKD